MEKTDREGENVMQALFDAVNAICGKIQVVSDLFWEFPTNFGWYAAIPILGNFSLAYFSAGGIFAVYGDAGRTGKYSWCDGCDFDRWSGRTVLDVAVGVFRDVHSLCRIHAVPDF